MPTTAASQRSRHGGYDSLGGGSRVCHGCQGTREVDNFGSKDGEVRKIVLSVPRSDYKPGH